MRRKSGYIQTDRLTDWLIDWLIDMQHTDPPSPMSGLGENFGGLFFNYFIWCILGGISLVLFLLGILKLYLKSAYPLLEIVLIGFYIWVPL